MCFPGDVVFDNKKHFTEPFFDEKRYFCVGEGKNCSPKEQKQQNYNRKL